MNSAMPSVPVWQVNVFTSSPSAGNPAGVVPEAHGLSEAEMQGIAREMGLSETAFLLPPSTDKADFRIRWFTPRCEVRICAHATIAMFHLLAEQGMHGLQNPGERHFTLETLSGMLPVDLERNAIHFGLPLPAFVNKPEYEGNLLHLLTIGPDDPDRRFDIVSDAEHIYLALKQLRSVQQLHPDMDAVSAYLDATGHTGVCIYTTETIDPRSHVHSRLFAPNVGIPEDPVTGSANGPLGILLGKLHRGRSSLTLIGEQGDEMGRPGRVIIRVGRDETGPLSVSVGGVAVTVMRP